MKRIKAIFLILIVLLMATGGYFFYTKFSASKMVNLEDTISGKSLDSDEVYLLIDDKYDDKNRAKKIDGKIYIPLEIANMLDSKFFYEKDTDEMLFTNEKQVIRFKKGERKSGSGEMFTSPPFMEVEGRKYISLEFIQKNSKLKVNTYDNPSRIVIFKNILKNNTADLLNGDIRTNPWTKAPLLKKDINDKVFIIKENVEGFSKIVTNDGIIGYVKKEELRNVDNNIVVSDEEEYKYFSLGKKVVLGFNQVTNAQASETAIKLDGIKKGINVISPTWFKLKDNNGNIEDISLITYSNQMHSLGIQVWALVDDFSKDVDTKTLLNNKEARTNLINNLTTAAKNAGCDGINIDFEKISPEASSAYIQFLRELYLVTREKKLIVSVDNYSPREYNKHYRLDQQADVVDYIIIMGYDEHTDGSDAGPVASYDYVKVGIENTLLHIPKNRVINAIPFYSRIWTENGKTKENNTSFTSKILSMHQQVEAIKKFSVSPKWDEVTKHNYLEEVIDAKMTKLWIEDSKLVKAKIDLVNQYDLGGVAMWKLGLETEDVWKEIVLK